jgi:hypothetical protein
VNILNQWAVAAVAAGLAGALFARFGCGIPTVLWGVALAGVAAHAATVAKVADDREFMSIAGDVVDAAMHSVWAAVVLAAALLCRVRGIYGEVAGDGVALAPGSAFIDMR